MSGKANIGELVMPWLCHRDPERSLHFQGKTLPLCARCTGYYTGLFMTIILVVIFRYLIAIPVVVVIIILLLSILPMALDGMSQQFRMKMSNNYKRVVTGFICGIGNGYVIVWLLSKI